MKERKAIRTLKQNNDIVIKPADKGGAIVILNKEDYIKEGERQLQQQQHYSKFDDFEKTKKKFIKEVETSLRSLKNKDYIDEDIFKLLFRPNPRTSNLYLLPKIHKKNNPGRPIINSVGSLTETISALVDEILRKYSKLAGSCIKDTKPLSSGNPKHTDSLRRYNQQQWMSWHYIQIYLMKMEYRKLRIP